ncbi:MAG: deoxyribonuclease IV [Euryarchaeota archaeon]|nr:deoxyribonuclease IV [Euryarchaeota archaeon]
MSLSNCEAEQSTNERELCLGAHISISGSFAHAVSIAQSYGCKCMQIFTKNPRTWHAKYIEPSLAAAFHEACEHASHASFPVFAHGSYLANPASSKPAQIEKSIPSILTEIMRCERLHIPYLVLHCGHGQDESLSLASDRVISCLIEVYSHLQEHPDHDHCHPVMILLENGPGDANCVGSTFEELATILDGVSDLGFSKLIGVCFDTCHAHAAGYALSTESEVGSVCDEFFSVIEHQRLHLIHLNDAAHPCGSGRDRHLPPGEGLIGNPGFSALLHHPFLRNLPFICEVPIPDSKSGQALIHSVTELCMRKE